MLVELNDKFVVVDGESMPSAVEPDSALASDRSSSSRCSTVVENLGPEKHPLLFHLQHLQAQVDVLKEERRASADAKWKPIRFTDFFKNL